MYRFAMIGIGRSVIARLHRIRSQLQKVRRAGACSCRVDFVDLLYGGAKAPPYVVSLINPNLSHTRKNGTRNIGYR